MTEKEKSLQKILDKIVDGKRIFGASFAIKKESLVWFVSSGKDQLVQEQTTKNREGLNTMYFLFYANFLCTA